MVEAVLQDGYIGIQAKLIEHVGDRISQDSDLSLHPEECQRKPAGQVNKIIALVFGEVDVLLLAVPIQKGVAFLDGQSLQANNLSLRHPLPRGDDDLKRNGGSAQKIQNMVLFIFGQRFEVVENQERGAPGKQVIGALDLVLDREVPDRRIAQAGADRDQNIG